MYDQADLTDFIDAVFEYNLYPYIGTIMGDLCFSEVQVMEIIDLLFSYGIIMVDEHECIIPLMSYEEAIILAQSIAME